MGTTLTGKRVQNTYDSLLKLSDNDNLTGSPKIVGSGLGTDSPIYLSTTSVGIGISPSVQFQTSGNAQIGNNLVIGGNLTVNGTTTIVDSTIIAIGDNMIELAKDNTANTKDIGWYGTIVESGTKFAGMYYDASTGVTTPEFHIGVGTVEPGSTAAWTTKGKLIIGALDATSGVFNGNVDITGLTTATKTQDGQSLFKFINASSGTSATSRVVAEADGGSVQLVAGGSNYAAVSGAWQDSGVVTTSSMSGGLILASDNGVAINANGGTRALTISATDQSATFTGIGQFAGAIRITETGTAQHILIGNQDSGGTNKPGMIRSANASLEFGYGDSWTGEGGTMTTSLTIGSDSSATFASLIRIPEYIVHSGDTDTFFGFVTDNEYKVTVGNSLSLIHI